MDLIINVRQLLVLPGILVMAQLHRVPHIMILVLIHITVREFIQLNLSEPIPVVLILFKKQFALSLM